MSKKPKIRTARTAFIDWVRRNYHIPYGAFLRLEWVHYRTGRKFDFAPTAVPLWWSQLSQHERLQLRRIPRRLQELK
jgi:hypothetical protein